MSNQFNKSLLLSEVLAKLNIEANFNGDEFIEAISDSNKVECNSICDYIKGPLPEHVPNLFIFVKESIPGYNCIVVNNPQLKIIELIDYVNETIGFKNKYKTTGIHPTVILGENTVIENNVEIGEGTVIQHNVVIHAGTRIGRNCLIRTNASIGGDGYGFVKLENGELVKQPHLGGAYLGDNVEIGANTCVVRGIVNDTYIGNSVKVDNLVHIAHDCYIDDEAFVIACAELSGYVRVGKRARIAPNACVKQRVSIGDDAIVGLGAVVLKNVENKGVVVGNPAKPLKA